jgi:hypothetical protein
MMVHGPMEGEPSTQLAKPGCAALNQAVLHLSDCLNGRSVIHTASCRWAALGATPDRKPAEMALTRSAIKRHKQGGGRMSEDGHQQGMKEHRRHVKVPPPPLAAAAACTGHHAVPCVGSAPCISCWQGLASHFMHLQAAHWRDLHDPATGRLLACRYGGGGGGKVHSLSSTAQSAVQAMIANAALL